VAGVVGVSHSVVSHEFNVNDTIYITEGFFKLKHTQNEVMD
jgi:hypothetical protein